MSLLYASQTANCRIVLLHGGINWLQHVMYRFSSQCTEERIQELQNLLDSINSTNQRLSSDLNSAMATISELMEQFDFLNSTNASSLVYIMLNKNTLGVKKCEANQKQHASRLV